MWTLHSPQVQSSKGQLMLSWQNAIVREALQLPLVLNIHVKWVELDASSIVDAIDSLSRLSTVKVLLS
ncbi:hypothetical protein TorRG33x02_030010 [Trema orientale]|uniref:Uncharacterized protein n=1 Tax=Trema orientale TaxID=63057 RepID=A0A2P5FTZ7_TREOI|nr:hypothetical protein TorRG33x02_030010 [Trema orientale]